LSEPSKIQADKNVSSFENIEHLQHPFRKTGTTRHELQNFSTCCSRYASSKWIDIPYL